MDLFNKDFIKQILFENGIRLTKKLGQNFLIDKNIVAKMVNSADIKNTDTILEIGPGIGILTQEIAKKAKFVIALEKDRALARIVQENFKDVKVIEADALKIDIKEAIPDSDDYKIIANLPYNIALKVIRVFLEHQYPPKSITVIIQKEVSQKICSTKSILPKIAFNFYGKPKNLFYISKECFWPKPKVDGAVLQITEIQKNMPDVDHKLFFKILKAGFSHPRKTILNNLLAFSDQKEKIINWLGKSGIDSQARAEILTLNDWIKLTCHFDL